MRFKKRFVFIRIRGERLSLSQARAFFGEKLKYFDEGAQEAVLKCNPKELGTVKKEFSGEKIFQGKNFALGVRRVSPSFALRLHKRMG